ncbi:Structural maintenance of chromosomes protein 1A [Frankliniella fusca]|uniref:Structural maintenance of chromosomes protein n=1 Tax=Frankliniella fusca TaxID=407009 RepID=A0AAE1I0A4_9NEOP|nr:Structural maintenance of chromosomes protein 1A [Frankliniella fusca]
MGVVLHLVELKNFKTYEGKVTVGPLKSFMSVIGPNGTGKSNLLDAILFALGVKLTDLRVKKPRELIHGASTGKPVSKEAYVTAVFKHEDGTFSKFKRLSSSSTQKYFYNGEEISSTEYLGKLKNLKINVKGNNFFVYQGRVEEIVMMSGKERTALFEEISGSNQYKREYDTCKAEMIQVTGETYSTVLKQRTVRNEYKDAKLMQREAETFEQLKKDLIKETTLFLLFKLYHNEKSCKELKEKKSQKESQLKSEKLAKEEQESKLKADRKSLRRGERELSSFEDKVQAKEKEIKEKNLKTLKDKEQLSHMRQKISSAQHSLQEAQEAKIKHANNLKILERELAIVEAEQMDYEKEIFEESMSQGKDLDLDESQAGEYNELKRQVINLSASFQQKLETLFREMRADQDQIDCCKGKVLELQTELNRKEKEKEEAVKRSEKISTCIASTEKELESLNEQLRSASEIALLQSQMDMLQEELNQVNSELEDAKSFRNEHINLTRRQEAIKTLKDLSSGVYDRLINLCEPIHQKYKVALTKVMGKWVDAIIVDTESTALLCIKHLKTHKMNSEVFLPLDYLEVKPLEERLREIKSAHLVYDVLRFNPLVKNAVLFATKSTMVAETADDAMQIANTRYERKQVNVVALDGTYFQKSGLISGGHNDLLFKAKQWDEKFLTQLKEKKEKLTESLKSIAKQIKLKSVSSVSCEIKGCSTRLELMRRDLEKLNSNIAVLDSGIEDRRIKLQNLELQIKEIEGKVQFCDIEYKRIDRKIQSIEDEVFAEFCKRIHVPNIRTYEEGGLKSYKERLTTRMEFEERKTQIINEIEYQKTINTEENISRWKNEVESRILALGNAEAAIEEHDQVVAAHQIELEEYKNQFAEKKREIAVLSQRKDELEIELKSRSEAIHTIEKEIISLESDLSRLINARRFHITDCRSEGIVLPLLYGDLESLPATASSETPGSRSTDVDSIVIDYDKLPDELKNIDKDAVKATEDNMCNNILKLAKKKDLMNMTNMRAEDLVDETNQRLRETTIECKEFRERARQIKENFERIKNQRYKKFMDVFDFVSEKIDTIYKEMAQSGSAMAILSAENPEEPYLSGLQYNCIAPGKACKPMETLSGGEKTIASLAFLLALHQYGASPCLILDEVDAALDNVNIRHIVNFLRNHKEDFQTIAVSLRPEFYGTVDGLVGVTHDGSDTPKSQVYLLDLEVYPENDGSEE